MMKIKVRYITTVEKVIEVNEKFYGLTESGGGNDLFIRERDQLTDELLGEVMDCIDVDCYHDIVYITEDGTEESMYEG